MNDWLDQFVICCCQWVSFLGCYFQIWNMLKPPTSLWTSPKYSLSLQPHSLYHWLILSIYRIHSTPLLVLKSCEITLFSVNSWKYIYTMDTDTTNSEQRVWVKKNVPSSFPLLKKAMPLGIQSPFPDRPTYYVNLVGYWIPLNPIRLHQTAIKPRQNPPRGP